MLDVEVTAVERGETAALVHLADGSIVHGDCVLWCGRRDGNSESLHLETIGVTPDAHGFVAVDEHFQTEAPGVYAAGDITGLPAAAATAMEHGRLAMCHAFQLSYKQHLASALPCVLWTIPEVAMVGETEETLRHRGRSYEIGKAYFSRNARGQILGDDGFVKLLFDPESQRILGASLVGEGACELIHVASTAMSFDGTLDTFIQGVFAYPTLAEAYKYAAYDGLQRLARRASRHAGLSRVTPASPEA
jgi:NAD(P) transhydrogenase